MNVEELAKVIEAEGIQRTSSALASLGYGLYPIATAPTLPASALVTGVIRLSSPTGYPLQGYPVVVTAVRSGARHVAGGANTALDLVETKSTFYTDGSGVAQIPLAKGARVRVDVASTSYSRELTVPQVNFDLLSTDLAGEFGDGLSSPSFAPRVLVRSDL